MNPGAVLRARAARALTDIVFEGVSLRVALAHGMAKTPDARDRALLSASLFAATRWWLRLDALLALLLDTPLPTAVRDIRALLVLAFAQIAVLGLPDHAAVAATVDAARVLGKPRHANLVNALLRRFLRERGTLEARLDSDPVTRHAHPRWLIDAIERDWPESAEDIFAANNREAPLTLRVNRRRCDPVALLALLRDAGIAAASHPELPDGLVLAQSTDVTRLPGYENGYFSVQDGAAQRVVDLLDPTDGLRALDACAAPGGKTAHLLERADVRLLALDRDRERVLLIEQNLARLGLAAMVRTADATTPADWWDGRAFDRILIDAPCSASGIVRRQPDVRLHRRAGDIATLAATQAHLLRMLWPLLASSGTLVYTTCSVLREENETVVSSLLAEQTDAHALPLPDNLGVVAGPGRQRLPGVGGMDGFYYAMVQKTG
ncbi:MAG: 16S rRNA (cytosine(967)-C(5))-methyltransferase RsmB [Rhodanobacteraceae bacterium]